MSGLSVGVALTNVREAIQLLDKVMLMLRDLPSAAETPACPLEDVLLWLHRAKQCLLVYRKKLYELGAT